MKKYLHSIFLIFSLIFCTDSIIDVIDENNYEPLDEIEISEGNFWIPTAVLPDTGNTIHYVKTLDIAVNDSNNRL